MAVPRSTDPDAVVTEFCDSWRRGDVDEIVAFFTEDGVWHNMPMEPTVGLDAIRAAFVHYFAVTANHRYDIHHQLSAGNIVMHERTDTMSIGDRVVMLPAVGVFEVQDGRIRVWRDYFDMTTFVGA